MMRVFCLIILCILTGCQSVHGPVRPGIKKNLYVRSPGEKSKPSWRQTKTLNPRAAVRTYKKPFVATAKDGAPTGPMPKLIKQAKPANEPFSRYGNPESYAVYGRKYEVMKSSGGYKTRGIASWYGTKFHSKRTSSGEDYDMYAMTAAHKTLPLPTYVKVRNLSNGRVAIVKVNDRGPFHDDRVIDLSYAAATKLGLLPKGTAPVEIEALTSTLPGKAHVAHYYVQAGAFSTEKFAHMLQDKLAKITPSPVFIEKYQQRFIVKVGPFAEKSMTDTLKNRLASQGVSGAFALLQ